MIHQEMKKNLRNREHSIILKSKVANLAHSYISAHHPTTQDVRKHRILQNLKNNNNIIVLRLDKGNGVVIMDRNEYIDCCLTIINDRKKFKCLHKDPTQIREGKLQRFLRKLRSEGQLNETTYKKIYPTGWQPARFYGLPKLHKKRDAGAPPPFRPTVSSIGAYNYNLSNYLALILGPCIPDKHTTLSQDSFSFVNEFTNIQSQNKFLISFDVESLFTNTPEFPISNSNLRELFTFATSQTHFLFNGLFYDQFD